MYLWILLIVFLLFLVALPLGKLIIASFESRDGGGFTIANYIEAYGRARYVGALLNSLLLSLVTATMAAVMAVPLAWAASRTNMPGKSLVWVGVLGAFMLPSYLGAIGWILLAGPNSGFINEAWRWISGSQAPLVNVFTFSGLALIIALQTFPLMFMFVKSSLDLVSSEMEDAANILGAGTWKATWKVTLPLVWPAILGSAIVVFLETMALFGTPAIIGIPARVNTATTQLWQFFEYPVRVEVASAYAMPMLLITLAMIGGQRILLGRKGYVAQSGKGGERRLINMGVWRWALLGYSVLVALLAVVMPAMVLLQASFSKAWGKGLALTNLTLENYRFLILEHTTAMSGVGNTLMFSAAAATLAVAIAVLVAYIVSRRLVPFGGALSFLVMAPFVIPGIVMAIGFYAAYASPPLSLYGTALIIILAFTARFLPIAFMSAKSAIGAVHPEMEEAARILGCGRIQSIMKITMSLLKKNLLGAWLIVFIFATQELSAAIFLVGPNTRTMSVLLYDLSEAGNFEQLAALGGIQMLITVLVVAVGMKLAGRDFMLRRS